MLRAPINPADLLTIDWAYPHALDADAPIGAEGVGMVEAVGGDVAALAPGDLVLPLTRGNWCRQRLVDADGLIRVPQDIFVDQAAMLRINPATALLVLDRIAPAPGQAIVQNGAGSAVARWVRHFASARGVSVIDVVRRPDPGTRDAIVDGPDLYSRVRAIAAPVAALDCVAGAATGRLAQTLCAGGRIVVFGQLSGEPISVPSQLLTGSGLRIEGFSLRPAEAMLPTGALQKSFARIFAAFGPGEMAPLPIAAVVPLSRIETAIAAARGRTKGRILLDLTA